MKNVAIVSGLLILTVILMGAFTGCGYRHATPEERANHIVEKVKDKLNLNEEQVAKLEIVKNEFLTASQDMKTKRKQIQTSVLEILEQPKLDQEQVLSMVKDKTHNINKKAPQLVAALAGFYDSLSPDQQKMLRDKIKDKMEHRRHSWNHY